MKGVARGGCEPPQKEPRGGGGWFAGHPKGTWGWHTVIPHWVGVTRPAGHPQRDGYLTGNYSFSFSIFYFKKKKI
jgi:hypothetical protein